MPSSPARLPSFTAVTNTLKENEKDNNNNNNNNKEEEEVEEEEKKKGQRITRMDSSISLIVFSKDKTFFVFAAINLHAASELQDLQQKLLGGNCTAGIFTHF